MGTGATEAFVCLMYHNVCADDAPYGALSPGITTYFVRDREFALHLQLMRANGATCCGYEILPRFYAAPAPAAVTEQPFQVVLTFDDGWRESVEVAGPILESAGSQALLFVTSGLVGRPHFLTAAQLQRLPAHVFRVGSHGRTHRPLSSLSEAEICEELHDSKTFLEDALGYPVDTLSLPGGAGDRRVRRLAAQIGYRFVLTSQVRLNRRHDDPLALGRIAVRKQTSPDAVRRYVRHEVARARWRSWLLHGAQCLLGRARYDGLRRRLLGAEADHKEMADL